MTIPRLSFHTIPQMPLTILTALMPLNKSADTFDNSADTLWRFHGYPLRILRNLLTILRKSFYNSADDLQNTHTIVKYLVTCTVVITALILLACFAWRDTCTIDLKACYLIRVHMCEICCSWEFKAFFRIHASSTWKGHGQSVSAFAGNPRNFWQDTAEFVGNAQLVTSTVLLIQKHTFFIWWRIFCLCSF